jgi:hypothetical protein
MRDLTSRLRAIVRTPVPARPAAGEAPPRELTYEADLGYGGSPDAEASAAALGGVVAGEGGCRFVTVDRAWDGDAWHGAHRVSSFSLDPGAPLGMLDPRLADLPDLTARPVFFDIETTGLSGGAGTLPFVAGCGWFEGSEFRVRQFFLTGPAGEPAMLDALGDVFGRASMLVTYNGRTFDIPTMETRWAFHRRGSAADGVPHFDMLPPARRFWGRGRPGARAGSAVERADRWSAAHPDRSCSLTALERSQLGFHRVGDVPGFEIPARYFQFLRTGDARAVEAVLEHNRLDLISLAAVSTRALRLVAGGPEACREPCEQAALGRLYERAGDVERALQAYDAAASGSDRDVRAHALARRAVLLRRQDRHREAAEAWQGILDEVPGEVPRTPLERRAAEALAIHHEHRARDLDAARRYAERLRGGAAGRVDDDVRHRLDRLDRKLHARGNTTGGREAARLFRDETRD